MEVDNAVEAEGMERDLGRLFRISLSFWANGLRLIDEDGITVADLRARAGAGCNVPGLERWGWIHIGDVDEGSRRRDGYGSSRGVKPETVLRPTRAGHWARRVWPEKLAEVDAAWRSRFGSRTLSGLEKALRGTGLVRPWGLPQVQPADGFRTHVRFDGTKAADQEARTPAPGEPAGDPPLAARLAAVLTAVTLEVEAEAAAPLPLSANFLRVLDSGPMAVREIPAAAGVSKEAATMAGGYLRRRGLATESERRLALTPTGRSALEESRAQVGGRGLGADSALRQALVRVLTQTDALCAGLHPAPGCWRDQKPYRAQTDRILADPLAALPRQPMVLHRGGWPDGA